ncbi:hypothetical protein DK842_07050 [Chromobacterium phragmitis]|uniref:Uncharacterized protein n=1 Tax=Chromobacterium phragmitis TaxID=2202141 RepID=A0A344UIG6_9NEIS|nr:hypothetical protein [Chromobacterium phragmitis]AXE29673.1 hypothetical protein DK842_07050 [Chromobacterium phragmitis]AXE35064.1 hypothetical protein DK843_12615 [Chromobacterium phragmitis]
MSQITAVNVPAKKEIEASNSIISQLKDYQSKNWAIGLNGDNLAPDGFLAFFTERRLPFAYYVRSQGVSVGEPSAYQINIDTLNHYVALIRSSEGLAVHGVITQLNHYKSQNWAIGLNGSTLQPDDFLPFFDTRGVPFAYYVRSGGVELGTPAAYENNIKALQQYLSSL